MQERLKRISMLLVAAGCAATPAHLRAGETTPSKGSGSGMTMKGEQEGTAFQSLTIEGEDRIHFQVERPRLDLALDPTRAPGLDWGSATDVLDRTVPDGVTPFLRGSTASLSPYLARPWLQQFASGDVARFQPQVEGVTSWRLTVANSRGEALRTFDGKGQPPREILWDGLSTKGEPAQPGLTYSYVLEARDKAGNKRNFVGQGFQLAAYRLPSPAGPVLAFTAPRAAAAVPGGATPASSTSPLVLESASWINQAPARPLRVTATARSFERANALATEVSRALAPLLIGDPTRVQAQAVVRPDAFEAGTVQIAPIP